MNLPTLRAVVALLASGLVAMAAQARGEQASVEVAAKAAGVASRFSPESVTRFES